jgi:hypothetical protein
LLARAAQNKPSHDRKGVVTKSEGQATSYREYRLRKVRFFKSIEPQINAFYKATYSQSQDMDMDELTSGLRLAASPDPWDPEVPGASPGPGPSLKPVPALIPVR